MNCTAFDLLCVSVTLSCNILMLSITLKPLNFVGLKAPITVRDLHSEVRRDWKQLIGRKLAHGTAVKTGLGECPKKRGSPEN
jgi:hypothetical protein